MSFKPLKTSAFALNLCKGAFAMKLWILILSIIFPFLGQGQNLVPNPSFENLVECPDTSVLDFHSLLDSTWYQWNSADCFNTCGTASYRGVPMNFSGGYQYPVTGNTYCGFIGYHGPVLFGREYIEVELDSTMQAGVTYYVRYHVNLCDSAQYAIENIDALFTDTLFNPFPPPSFNWQPATPQFKNSAGNLLNDKINWMVVEGSFIASGGEKFVTLGNFDDDSNTNTQIVNVPALGSEAVAYYFIDEVYVGKTPPPVGISETEVKGAIKVYPNPSIGMLTLECDLLESKSVLLNIYNITGKLVHRYCLEQGSHSRIIDTSDLLSGLYFYEAIADNKIIGKDILTILK
jgi:hypothetical protein